MTNVYQMRPGFDFHNAMPHGFIGELAQALGRDRSFSHDEHATGVAMPTVLDHRDVNVDDVPFFQDFLTGNAMANLVVDRGANRFGVGVAATGVVMEWGRNGVLNLGDVIVRQLVQGVGGDTRIHMRGEVIQHLGGQSASLPHARDALFVFVSNAHGLELSQGRLAVRLRQVIPVKSAQH